MSDEHETMSNLIEDHLAHLRATGQSDYTIRSRTSVLRRLHAELPRGIGRAAVADIQAWLNQYQDWTLCTYDGHIRAFYTWADGVHLDASAYLHTRRPKWPDCIPDPVTDDELRDALTRSGPYWRLPIHLASLAGLRAFEIAELRREDVTESSVLVRRGKGGRAGTVPTHPDLWELVQPHRPGRLVLTAAGRPSTGRYLSSIARRHFDRIGMPDVHLHRFRHWFGTSMLNAGANIRTVQECLRHKDLKSTQGYSLVTGVQRRDAVRALPSLTD